jgi:hypothetical protein
MPALGLKQGGQGACGIGSEHWPEEELDEQKVTAGLPGHGVGAHGGLSGELA